MFKMSKETMRDRIEEAVKAGSQQEIVRRVEVCLWGLQKSKDGVEQANALISELGLEKYGAKKIAALP